MKKYLRHLLFIIILTIILILPYFVFAQDVGEVSNDGATSALNKLTVVAEDGGYQQSALSEIIGGIISAALSLLGAIFIILLIIGGYDWMTAEGSDEKVQKAKDYIKRAIIGMLITLSSWAIWEFILRRFILSE